MPLQGALATNVWGIIGYIGLRQAVTVLLPTLRRIRRIEYRGYDSARIATVNGKASKMRKTVGKIVSLEALLGGTRIQGWPTPPPLL